MNEMRTKPTTTTRPVHAAATAKVYIDGLSIHTYNETTRETKVYFVKGHHSPVRVRIYNEDCDVLYSYDGIQDEKVQINIKKIVPRDRGSEYYEHTKTDDDDYLWVPDLTRWYNRPTMDFFLDAKNYISTKLVLTDTAFYTRKRSKYNARLLSQSGTPPPIPPERISRIVGGDIKCTKAEEGVEISITNAGTVRLPKRNGPFYIYIMTEPESGGNHMDYVYDHIIKLRDREPRYYLQFQPPTGQREPGLRFECGTDDFEEYRSKTATEYACQVHGGGNGDPVFP